MNFELQQETSSLDDNWLVGIRMVQVSSVQGEGSSEVLQVDSNSSKASQLSQQKKCNKLFCSGNSALCQYQF